MVTKNVTYSYDNSATGTNGMGKLHQMITGSATSPDVTLTFNKYDPFGRVNSITKNIIGDQDRTTGYEYDPAGRLSKVIYPDNYALSYEYCPSTMLLKRQ